MAVKLMICTTPIRPVPTDYPPFGSLAVIQALQNAGYAPVFFDIDGLRPSFAEVIERFRQEAPDVIGVSAVVSTAYGYVKRLGRAIREVLPKTRIVLGGNLAASAELLHRYCGIDICVIGEGERVIVNLVRYLDRQVDQLDYEGLKRIKGLTYLEPGGEMIFTGYEEAIPAEEFIDPDFSLLEKYSNIGNFITDPFSRDDFAKDPRSGERHRAGKKMGTVISTKGCVARCTFCHRWDRGFRQVAPERVVGRIKYLVDRYNVGFIAFGDENFGSDRKATDELIRLLKPLDILWCVGGVRARSIDLDLLKRMHEAGCAALHYGFETGSPDILKVMEKKLDLSDNYNAARCTREAGLYTVYQLVLGMPGESDRTIVDTIRMVKQITEFLPAPPSLFLSINYIQALPGTPVYEYARAKGLIGPGLEEEEAYLLTISDIDAGDDTKFLNFTAYPYLVVQSWRFRILYEAMVHWVRVRRNRDRNSLPQSNEEDFKPYQRGGYFNLHNIARDARVLSALYPFRWILIWFWTITSVFRRGSKREFFAHIWELLLRPVRRQQTLSDHRSLRHIMRDMPPRPATQTEENMIPLRLGR